jgi:hypothetical protein
MTNDDMEFDSYLDQEQAGARDWYAEVFRDSPEHLMLLTSACAADDTKLFRKLGSEHLDCIQRLALLKLHELTKEYRDSK